MHTIKIEMDWQARRTATAMLYSVITIRMTELQLQELDEIAWKVHAACAGKGKDGAHMIYLDTDKERDCVKRFGWWLWEICKIKGKVEFEDDREIYCKPKRGPAWSDNTLHIMALLAAQLIYSFNTAKAPRWSHAAPVKIHAFSSED